MSALGYCVVGTDTDVGKTFVTAALLRAFRAAGLPVRALKPVQSGGVVTGDVCTAPDVDVYVDAAGPGLAPDPLYCFPTPCSPDLAAELAGERISMADLADHCRENLSPDHTLLLEGAGGIMTPLAPGRTYLDLFKELGLPLILVADNRLGMINHTRLTLEVLDLHGLTVKALVINQCSEAVADGDADLIRRGNIAYLKESFPELTVVENPHGSGDWEGTELPFADLVRELAGAGKRDMSAETIQKLDRDHIWHPYAPAPGAFEGQNCVIRRAQGHYLQGEDGPLLDGMSSWWAAIHGYNHPEINRAAIRQIQTLSHVMFGGITHEPAAALTRTLLKILPEGLTRVFFADSGSVSVEVALKMAIQYWQGMGRPEKEKLLTIRGGYHGDTFGAMGVCDPENGMHHKFTPMLAGHVFIPRPSCRFDDPFDPACLAEAARLVEKHAHTAAALILEPIVQGAGGMWFYHPEYLKGLSELCQRHDVLLICDEIATGFGRTGKMFASQWAGISPDILCMGKGLTGGYVSLAAVATTEKISQGLSNDGGVLMHGPTFMGNPLACAVAQKSLELLLDFPWAERVAGVEAALKAGLEPLKDLPQVADVRVLGAMGVVETRDLVDTDKCREFVVKDGVWLRPFRNLIYTMPPYGLSRDEVGRITQVMGDLVRSGAYR